LDGAFGRGLLVAAGWRRPVDCRALAISQRQPRPGMSVKGHSKLIARLEIVQGRSAETIRKNMKPQKAGRRFSPNFPHGDPQYFVTFRRYKTVLPPSH
jgi:hypothetical protein